MVFVHIKHIKMQAEILVNWISSRNFVVVVRNCQVL